MPADSRQLPWPWPRRGAALCRDTALRRGATLRRGTGRGGNRWALLFAAAATLLATPAAAQRQAVTLVVLPDREGDGAIAQDLRRDILKAFTQDPTVQLVDPLKRGPLKETAAPVIEESIAEGKALLRRRKFREAIAPFEQAIADIQSEISKVSKATISDAQIHLAAAYLGARKRSRALQTLHALLAWRPQHGLLLQTGAPPGWAALTERARKWLSVAPTGSVLITSMPSRAEAFVDGRRIGPTPVEASNLLVGVHFITLKLDGYRRLVLPVRVSEGSRTVAGTLRSDPRTSQIVALFEGARSSIGSPRMAQLEGLDLELGTSRVLLVLVSATRSTREIKAFLYQLRDQRLMARTVLDTGTQISADQLTALALWRIRGTAPPVPPRRIAAPAGEDKPFYKTWWFWTLAGVGVAGVGLGVALPLALSDGSVPDTESFYLQW